MTRTASCCPPPGGSYGSVKFYLAAGLVLLLSLAATLYFCLSMSGGMEMPGGWRMSMMWMPMPNQSRLAAALMFLAMWLAMMVAMMLPSFMSKLLLFYRSLVWKRAAHPALSAAMVALGYFTVWTAIGAGVYAIGLPWSQAAMRWPDLSRTVPILTGLLLILAGAYQFSPWKREGLGHCRKGMVYGMAPKGRRRTPQRQNPLPEIIEDADWKSSFFQGLRQGLSCAVCCASSMLVLVALGAMNLMVMLAVALVIALEKWLPKPILFVRIAAFLSIFGGVAILAGSLSVFSRMTLP